MFLNYNIIIQYKQKISMISNFGLFRFVETVRLLKFLYHCYTVLQAYPG
jgi:hypothetical protein